MLKAFKKAKKNIIQEKINHSEFKQVICNIGNVGLMKDFCKERFYGVSSWNQQVCLTKICDENLMVEYMAYVCGGQKMLRKLKKHNKTKICHKKISPVQTLDLPISYEIPATASFVAECLPCNFKNSTVELKNEDSDDLDQYADAIEEDIKPTSMVIDLPVTDQVKRTRHYLPRSCKKIK